MATAYYSPGVYIEEVDKGPKPIQGVSTSITAFIGITERAEIVNEDGYTTRSLLSEPKLITNWSQYETYFGSYHENAYLPYSVRGFFDNGGVTAWVISIHAINTLPAQALLYAKNPKDASKPGQASLMIHAKAGGPVGENIKVSIVDGTANGNSGSNGKSSSASDPKGDGDAKAQNKNRRGNDVVSALASGTGDEQNASTTITAGASTTSQEGSSGGSGEPPKVVNNNSQTANNGTEGAQFALVVQVGAEAPQNIPLKLDDLPFWGDRSREDGKAHDSFGPVKVWRLTKSGKIEERLPKPVADLKLSGGVAKFDLDLLKEESDRTLLRGTPEAKEEEEVLQRNAVQLFNGSATLRKGAEGLEAIDNLNLICAPDLVLLHKNKIFDTDNPVENDSKLIGLQKSLLSFCERTNYRFAILDSPADRKLPEDILKWRQHTANFDATHGHGALYYPWIKITDPLTGKTKEVPPCGHIAGIYARSDSQRGVHKAPANEQILGPVTNVTINVTKGEQDLLNPVGVNCIRAFPGRGIRVWGARTLSSDPAWRYINVRRLFSYVEESVERSTQWVVFEPNEFFLWARVRRDITAFLNTVWMSGALFGNSPDQAFYVKCDEELNPQEIRDQGLMICEIGMAPVKPAEFVVFRFSQYAITAG